LLGAHQAGGRRRTGTDEVPGRPEPPPSSIELRPARGRRSALALFILATFSMLAILSTPLGRFVPLLRTPFSNVVLGRIDALVRPFMRLVVPGDTVATPNLNAQISAFGPSASGPAGGSPGSPSPSSHGPGSGGSGGAPPPLKHGGPHRPTRRLRAKFDGHIHAHSFEWLRQNTRQHDARSHHPRSNGHDQPHRSPSHGHGGGHGNH